MTEQCTPKSVVEFWRWSEYHRILKDKKWTSKDLITAGVDVGSVGSKAAVMVNGEAYSWAVARTGSNSPDSARKVLDCALKDTGLVVSDLKYVTIFGDQASIRFLMLEGRTLKLYASTKRAE